MALAIVTETNTQSRPGLGPITTGVDDNSGKVRLSRHCPTCGKEYLPFYSVCSVDKTPLVASVAPPRPAAALPCESITRLAPFTPAIAIPHELNGPVDGDLEMRNAVTDPDSLPSFGDSKFSDSKYSDSKKFSDSAKTPVDAATATPKPALEEQPTLVELLPSTLSAAVSAIISSVSNEQRVEQIERATPTAVVEADAPTPLVPLNFDGSSSLPQTERRDPFVFSPDVIVASSPEKLIEAELPVPDHAATHTVPAIPSAEPPQPAANVSHTDLARLRSPLRAELQRIYSAIALVARTLREHILRRERPIANAEPARVAAPAFLLAVTESLDLKRYWAGWILALGGFVMALWIVFADPRNPMEPWHAVPTVTIRGLPQPTPPKPAVSLQTPRAVERAANRFIKNATPTAASAPAPIATTVSTKPAQLYQSSPENSPTRVRDTRRSRRVTLRTKKRLTESSRASLIAAQPTRERRRRKSASARQAVATSKRQAQTQRAVVHSEGTVDPFEE